MSTLLHPKGDNLPDYKWSRMLGQTSSDFDFKALENSLDCLRDFYGVGIIYNDDSHSYLVRPSRGSSLSGQNQVTHVVVTRVVQLSAEAVTKSVKDAVSAPSLGTEIASTFLSCGALVLTAAATVVAAGAAPVTGGVSAPLAILAAAGTAATAIQCGNGLWRLYDIEVNDAKNVIWLDSQDWYTSTSTALDIVSLASAGGALKEVIVTYKAMKSASSMRVIDWLKSYSRAERTRLTEGIIKFLNPGISNKTIKVMIKAGKYPRRFPTEAIHKKLQEQLINSITSGMGVTGSAVSGVIRSPESINNSAKYVIGLLQSLSTVN